MLHCAEPMAPRVTLGIAAGLIACSPKGAHMVGQEARYEWVPGRTTSRAGEPEDPSDPRVEIMWLVGARGCAKIRFGGVACWNADAAASEDGRFAQAAWSKARCGRLCAFPADASEPLVSLPKHQVDLGKSACSIRQRRIVSCEGGLPVPELDDVMTVRTSLDGEPNACALLYDQSVWCWGSPDGPYGRLTGGRPTPIQVHFAMRGNPNAAVVDAPPARAPRSPSCLVHRPCDGETKPLLPCTTSVGATPWRQVAAEADALIGNRVVVRGVLRIVPVGCTLAYCENRCCNECRGTYEIGDDDNPAAPYAILEDVEPCMGDESRLCCPYAADSERVVVAGLLARPRLGTFPFAVRVESLCEMEH